MKAGQKPNIGISFFASADPRHSIWSNGTLQNVLFLLLLFRASGQAGKLWLINGGDSERMPHGLCFDGIELEMVRFDQVAGQLDVLIECGAAVRPEQARAVHQRGGVVVAYRCGNDYIMDAERICFDLQPGSLFNGAVFDEVWTQAQHVAMCRSYWEIELRAPVRVLPHIWSPLFVERAASQLKQSDNVEFGYVAGSGKKRVAVFEPNLNVVKTCLTPMLICEAAYRRDPQAVSEVYITNTRGMTEHPTFQHIIRAMEIYRNKVMSFEARYSLPMFMARFADVVVAHQWENGLNYLYYDVLHGNYPLIHNSPFLRSVGYYYEGFDATAGAEALLRALSEHDRHLDEYQANSKAVLDRVSILHPHNQQAHMERLLSLLAQKRAAA